MKQYEQPKKCRVKFMDGIIKEKRYLYMTPDELRAEYELLKLKEQEAVDRGDRYKMLFIGCAVGMLIMAVKIYLLT